MDLINISFVCYFAPLCETPIPSSYTHPQSRGNVQETHTSRQTHCAVLEHGICTGNPHIQNIYLSVGLYILVYALCSHRSVLRVRVFMPRRQGTSWNREPPCARLYFNLAGTIVGY